MLTSYFLRLSFCFGSSASAYSMVSLVQKFGPIMNPGGSVLSLTYIASEKVAIFVHTHVHMISPLVMHMHTHVHLHAHAQSRRRRACTRAWAYYNVRTTMCMCT